MSKYEILAAELLKRIVGGDYPDGKLSSMQALATEYAVSLQTVNRAIKLLEQQGAVSCTIGSAGTRINRGRAEMLGDKTGYCVSFDQQLPTTPSTLKFLFASGIIAGELAGLIATFKKRYPWIEVEPIQVPEVCRAILDNTPFDVALLNSRNLGSLARLGRLRELPDEGEAFDPLRQGCRWMGGCYGMPFNWSLPVLRSSGRATGMVNGGELGQTFRDALNSAPPVNVSVKIGLYSLLVLYLGDLNGRQLTAADEVQICRVVQFLKPLCRLNKAGNYLWHNPDFVNDGNSLFFSYLNSDPDQPSESTGWTWAPVEKGKKGAIPLTAESLVLAAGSEYVREGWLWCSFLLRGEIQRQLAAHPLFLSPLPEVFNETAPEILQRVIPVIRQSGVVSTLPTRGLFMLYSSVFSCLEEYLADRLSLEDTAAEIRQRFNEIIYVHEKF